MSFTSCNKGVLGCMDTTYLPSFERLATFLLLKCLHSEPNGPELKLGSRFLNHYVSEMMLFFIRVKAFGAFSHPCPSSWRCKYCQLLHHSLMEHLFCKTCVLFISFFTAKSLIFHNVLKRYPQSSWTCTTLAWKCRTLGQSQPFFKENISCDWLRGVHFHAKIVHVQELWRYHSSHSSLIR